MNLYTDEHSEYFIENVVRPVANENMLPQEVYRDQDGFLNHTCFGCRFIGESFVCILPTEYWRI